MTPEMSSTPSIDPANTLPTSVEPGTQRRLRGGNAARLAGLSSSTLRIWEHRYGVVSPAKSSSGQRTCSMDVDALVRLSGGEPDDVVERAAGSCRWPHLGPETRRTATTIPDDRVRGPRPRAKGFARGGPADVPVVRVASLHASVTERVLALRLNLPARMVVAVYSFGTSHRLTAMRN